METAEHAHVVAIFKALAHPERLHLVEMLAEGDRCVCDLAAALEQRQPYVSQQLAMLREAGLVTCWRDGWRVYYRLTQPVALRWIAEARALAQGGDERLVHGICQMEDQAHAQRQSAGARMPELQTTGTARATRGARTRRCCGD